MKLIKKTSNVAIGDFKAELSKGSLLVPSDLYEILRERGIFSAEEFISFIHGFPTCLVDALGWPPESLTLAIVSLKEQLEGQVHPDILDPV